MNVTLSGHELATLSLLLKEDISFKRRCLRTLHLSSLDRKSLVDDLDHLYALKEKIDYAKRKRDDNELKHAYERIWRNKKHEN